ncbi:PilT/PilU family type 4a pilus ATPase [Motiliproteus sp. MSK22-1]|uniref:PilT/PilU family type 4a pilus ATPase n=1 Tax=Motiliproteus sp. MSK22-1 TaxID=1897630 RepID=UPI00097668D6|nr:PilT/PilU family type 4a pilus ATPase [Motiliproteus sp. MSK22-1]OMH33697.1 type IV pili twitching motility protein PilT [Motiliproteus sp. MSK22-1]
MSEELDKYLEKMVELEGADLFLSTNARPSSKVHGKMVPLADDVMVRGRIKEIAYAIMNEKQIREFEERPEMNLALSKPGLGRFRVNIFRQRHEYSMVIRSIATEIPDAKSLGLPKVLKNLIMEKRGLILFVGGTGSGKSTSLASLIDHRNRNSSGHIITIEDPVEFVHSHKQSIINQREVGVDTLNYEDALENTLRQAPDVILIGEIRSAETMEYALAFAETGHLCLSTLHANNANQALGRIINFFPQERHNQLFLDLSLNMKGVISQRLLPTKDGKRAAAIEVLLGSPRVNDMIKHGRIDEIKEVMEKSANQGMQTFDMALFNLWKTGKIKAEDALKNSDSKTNLALKMRLAAQKKPEAGATPDGQSDESEQPDQASAPKMALSLEMDDEDDKDDSNSTHDDPSSTNG